MEPSAHWTKIRGVSLYSDGRGEGEGEWGERKRERDIFA